ncbi:1,2-dihydroxy-3-keto-5-methylthiopentene dioxygenase, partial [Boothiomyces macroporosus]
MVTAWYYKESEAENTEPHQYSPSQPVSNEKLDELGVLQWHFDPDTEFDKIDIHKDRFPNYKEKLGIFATEHLHDDEESRYVLDGAGFFDIRGKDEKWIRIHVQKGDWIILPA